MTEPSKNQQQQNKRKKLIVIIAATATCVLLVAGMIYFRRSFDGIWNRTRTEGAASLMPRPDVREPVALTLPANPLKLAVRIDVDKPDAWLAWFEKNAQPLVDSPLGQGFIGSWAGWFGSKGEELGKTFKGTLAKHLIDRVLQQPVSLALFTGDSSPAVPALVIGSPTGGARATLTALDELLNNQEVTAPSCEGGAPTSIHRWLVAGQGMYFAANDTRAVLASKPLAVWSALCAADAFAPSKEGVLDVTVRAAGFSREAQMFAKLAGIGSEALVLSLKLDGDRLVPVGLKGDFDEKRGTQVAFSEAHWRTIPESAPVVASVALKLPDALEDDSLAEFLKDRKGTTVNRAVSLVWWPSGEGHDVAIVWTSGAAGDEAYLKRTFDGASDVAVVCDQIVITTAPSRMQAMRDACGKKQPALADAGAAALEAVKGDTSAAVSLHAGHFLSQALLDSVSRTPAKEISDAAAQIDALPRLWFSGVGKAQALLPKGGRS